MKITLPLVPSPQGRGKEVVPSPLGGEGWERGIFGSMTYREDIIFQKSSKNLNKQLWHPLK
ncbi:MAG: hypothetical protein HZC48_12495 [Nitrospirae bacterium]|nr:hypothetical protein [Nitrospirota bacterium]